MQDKFLNIAADLAKELRIDDCWVKQVIYLLNNKCTVQYIAKYCKSQTGSMSLKNIHIIARSLLDFYKLEERRADIIKSISEQNKLSADLLEIIQTADSLQTLEDIYLPFIQKRQTKALQAINRGLGPLASELLITYAANEEELSETFVNSENGVLNNKMALDGARQILLERFSENANFLQIMRKYFWENALIITSNLKMRSDKNSIKYKEFFDYSKQISQIPPNKIFDIFAGRSDNYLKISVNLINSLEYGFNAICDFFNLDKARVLESAWLSKVIEDSWTIKLLPKLEAETLQQLRDKAASVNLNDLANYLRGLFYLPPAGNLVTMGLIPNAKSGVAVAVVDEFGELLDSCIIYPLGLNGNWYQALASIAKFAIKFNVSLISIANLPGYRDIERLCRQLQTMYKDLRLSLNIMDSYALLEVAELAASQNKEHDYLIFAAISLARRGQNPLAEFAKINSKNLGLVQPDFMRSKYQIIYDEILEDAICTMGIDLNNVTLSVLSRLPGINQDIAVNIINYRASHGRFNARAELKKVPGIDDFVYQQLAGFVYVFDGENILDTLNIHPNSYYVAEKMSKNLAVSLRNLISNHALLDKILPEEYVDDKHDLQSIKDIVIWLKYKVKDPRGIFTSLKTNQHIVSINHLEKDLELEGIVTKITTFGAFVDVGVYQDGLLPLALIKDKIGKAIKVGKIIQVKIAEIDKNKKRFSLVLNSLEKTVIPKAPKVEKRPEEVKQKTKLNHQLFNTAMADAFSKLKRGE